MTKGILLKAELKTNKRVQYEGKFYTITLNSNFKIMKMQITERLIVNFVYMNFGLYEMKSCIDQTKIRASVKNNIENTFSFRSIDKINIGNLWMNDYS